MSVKRGATEDVYVVALQRLSDMAKAILPEPQCPAVGCLVQPGVSALG